jgi:hypothetical protein
MKTKDALEMTTARAAKKVFRQRSAIVKLKTKFRGFHWQDKRRKVIVIIADTSKGKNLT